MHFEDLMRPHLRNVKPYVPGKPTEELRREKNFKGEIIKLASNENSHPPIEEIKKAISDEMANINRYPNSGCYYLCRELAEYHGLTSDNIFVGNGSNEIIDLLVRAFLNPGEEIVYPFPSFIVYPIVTQLAGVEGIEVPLQDYRLDLDAMKQNITRKTKMVFICNPNNPTGTYVTQKEVEIFLNGLRPDILVVFDEAYFEYVVADDYPDTMSLMRQHRNIIILRTFSKIFSLSGLRIGYSISDAEIVTCLHKVRQPFNVNRIAQVSARAALAYADKVKKLVEENREQLKFVCEEMQKLGFTVPPSQTNFILAIPPAGKIDIVDKLMNVGIIVRGTKPFGLGEAFRVTIGTPYENERFISALNDLM